MTEREAMLTLGDTEQRAPALRVELLRELQASAGREVHHGGDDVEDYRLGWRAVALAHSKDERLELLAVTLTLAPHPRDARKINEREIVLVAAKDLELDRLILDALGAAGNCLCELVHLGGHL